METPCVGPKCIGPNCICKDLDHARREDAAGAEPDLVIGKRHYYRLHTSAGPEWRERINNPRGWLPFESTREALDRIAELQAALSTAEREREALEILSATLLCELGRAEDPRLGGDTITVYDLAKRPTQTTPFKASFPRALTAAEARAILARVPSGGEEGR